MKKMLALSTALVVAALAGPAVAGPCSEQIMKLQEAAKASDAKNSPGSQETAKNPSGQTSGASAGSDGGGTQSVSAKILEAQARDQRRDEPGCMKAVEEAKKLIGS